MKKKVVLFGASQGGQNFINHQDEYEIVAIADNDEKKHGSTVFGYKVISPQKINNYFYDYVVITSMFFEQIKDQLVKELLIDEGRIKVAPKATMKAVYRPFECSKTMRFAKEKLSLLINLFNEHNIRYFADFGTLLGAVRDNDIIPWDDDIDLSILLEDYETVLNFLETNLVLLNDSSEVKWEGHVTFKSDENPTNISLKFITEEASNIKQFQINIGVITFSKNQAKQELNSVPKHHFMGREFIEFLGTKVSVPNDYERYLELTYGDWKTPKKDTDYSEYSISKDVTVIPNRVPITLKGNNL